MKIEYNNLYTHYVMVTSNRQSVIPESSRDRIEKYITGVVNNNDSHLYAIYLNPDHLHLLVSRSPALSDQKLASLVAESSERFMNENRLVAGQFHWQQSCSAFSVSKGHVDRVCKYILSQPEHHRKFTFAEEYERFIRHYQKTINRGE